MITLHRLHHQEFVLNADLIETIEATPDTLVTLTDGKKLLVLDGIQEIVDKVITYRKVCNSTIRIEHEEKPNPSPDMQ